MMVTEKPWYSKSDPQWCKLELLQCVKGTLPIYTGWIGSLVLPAWLSSTHVQLKVAYWGTIWIYATLSSWVIQLEKKYKDAHAEVKPDICSYLELRGSWYCSFSMKMATESWTDRERLLIQCQVVSLKALGLSCKRGEKKSIFSL